MYKVDLPDNYSVVNNNGIIDVWKGHTLDTIRNDRYCGDRVVLFLMQRIEELESKLNG